LTVIGRMMLWKWAIERRPGARQYMDQALTPVRDDDEETLELLTKTAGAKAAVDHLKKVHDITHGKPAAVV
jgi:hypothetical protein